MLCPAILKRVVEEKETGVRVCMFSSLFLVRKDWMQKHYSNKVHWNLFRQSALSLQRPAVSLSSGLTFTSTLLIEVEQGFETLVLVQQWCCWLCKRISIHSFTMKPWNHTKCQSTLLMWEFRFTQQCRWRFKSYRMLCLIAWLTNGKWYFKEHSAFIFRVKQ
jgi:hypothetical protein